MNTKWTPNPEGEYGEHYAKIQGHMITVSSDRDGEIWDCCINGGEFFRLDAHSKYEAFREAEALAV